MTSLLRRFMRRSVFATVALCTLSFAASSAARDNGQYANVSSTIKSWIESLKDENNIPCCATADGFVPSGIVWEIGANHYRVKVFGEWLVVPTSAVIKGPNRLGHAVVWVDASDETITVRCFLPGPGS
jgi:hypothetical protein